MLPPMAYRRRVASSHQVDLLEVDALDALPALTGGALERPAWAGALGAAWERAVGGARVRGVVAVPVQHGKSTTICGAIPWALARRPEMTIAYLTYSQRLSDRNSRVMRGWAELSGAKLSPDHNRIEEWRTTKGGGLVASGVHGPLTGYRVDIAVIDDPFKDAQDADSETIREDVWNWFLYVVSTRIPAHGSIFVIASRWNDDDLSGRLLRGDWRGEHFDLVHYPAIRVDEHGDEHALWESHMPLAELRRRREALPARVWQSLYQGSPRPDEGALFKAATWADVEQAAREVAA